MGFIYSPTDDTTAESCAVAFAKGHERAIMLVYTPTTPRFFRAVDGGWRDAQKREPDWAAAFELRAFDEDAELRWVHEGVGRGIPVTVTDGAPSAGAPNLGRYRRRIWGTKQRVEGGWVHLRAGRIGDLPVPDPGGEQRSVLGLEAVEATEQDAHGNWSVVDERWTALRWIG